ncbi:hypothetical protein Q3G72_011633 [Acer saccharum]|nr:hypothetical protein Q3G72_011633 [Acer saccharum]
MGRQSETHLFLFLLYNRLELKMEVVCKPHLATVEQASSNDVIVKVEEANPYPSVLSDVFYTSKLDSIHQIIGSSVEVTLILVLILFLLYNKGIDLRRRQRFRR